MNTLAPLAPLLPQADAGKREFRGGSLTIRDKTLVVGNTIYSIGNVSSISLMDLRKELPFGFWAALVVAALFLVAGGDLRGLCILFLLLAGGVYIHHQWNRSAADYLLTISMNSGSTAGVFSNQADFLKDIALELYRVIELNFSSNSVFNIDRSVKLDGITGSTVSVGHVSGDLVNTVLAEV